MVKKLTMQEIQVALFFLWGILLLPWLAFCPLSGMAFDPGPSFEAYLLVISICTYPLPVIIAAIYRKRAPLLVLLPFLNLGILTIAVLIARL